jgi:hypothetical protein
MSMRHAQVVAHGEYHAVITKADTPDAVVMELVPIDGTDGTIPMIARSAEVIKNNNTVLSYYGNLLQIEKWLKYRILDHFSFSPRNNNRLNQMTPTQMRKSLLIN